MKKYKNNVYKKNLYIHYYMKKDILKFKSRNQFLIYNPNTIVIEKPKQNKIEKPPKKKSLSIIIR